jgi:hypothetical protein
MNDPLRADLGEERLHGGRVSDVEWKRARVAFARRRVAGGPGSGPGQGGLAAETGGHHLEPPPEELPDEVATGEPGGAGDEHGPHVSGSPQRTRQ